jgi:hypothetical protein
MRGGYYASEVAARPFTPSSLVSRSRPDQRHYSPPAYLSAGGLINAERLSQTFGTLQRAENIGQCNGSKIRLVG